MSDPSSTRDAPARRRALFLAINATYAHSNLAAWYLREIAEQGGWAWRELELTIQDDLHPALAAADAFGPELVLASVWLFNRAPVLSFVRRFHALHPGTPVVLGGPEFLGDNRGFCAGEPAVTAVVRGEGERAFRSMLARGGDPAAWRGIPGVCGVFGGGYSDGGNAEPATSFDDVPSPYARHAGSFRKPFVQIEASRGCRNRCSFCTSAGAPVRHAGLERVRADLKQVRDLGVRGVRLIDRTFNDRPTRAISLLRMAREEFGGLRFHLEVDPAMLTSGLLAELAAWPDGLLHVEAGVQSLSPGVYGAVARGATVGRTFEGVRQLCALGSIDVHVDLIAGLPGGTLAGVLSDLRALIGLKPGAIQLEVLKVLPGTRLAAERERLGIAAAPEPPYEVLRTPDMSVEEIGAARVLSRLVDGYYNAAALRDVAIAANADAGFWPAFVAYGVEHGVGAGFSLEQRFRLLDGFWAGTRGPLRWRLHYAWIKWGMGARGGLCPVRAWAGRVPEGASLVEGTPGRRPARMVAADLDRPYLFEFGAEDGDRRAVAVYALPTA